MPATAAKTHRNRTADTDRISLLCRIASGDRSAVSECIERYGDLIWFLARKYCPVASDAEDAVQDIFIEIWQKAASFDPSLASEQTFLTMVARRRLIDRRRRQLSGVQCVPCDDQQLINAEQATLDTVELEDEAAKAAECMEKLSPVQRSVLTMNICEGHSQATISESLNLPLGTVKSFARRGLLLLRDCMNRTATTLPASRPS